jgi:ribulose bisphosphate carboxylase small subunit
MHADLAGALKQLNKSYKAFEHRGKEMTKVQVRKVLEYGLGKGYKTTAELTDEEVDKIINENPTSNGATKISFSD